MKTIIQRSVCLILTFVMCSSMLFGINLETYAASVDYVYAGKYIYNWGKREEVATFLSQNAIAFYEDNDTSYKELSALSGSSNISNVMSSALYKELQSLMKGNHSYITSYNVTRPLFQYTDCQNSGKTSKGISSFYSGIEVGPAWDGGGTWNREHVWPNSKGSGDGENDIMMLRPTSVSENSSRGNKAYGEGGVYYNPNKESNGAHDLRGDVSRIVLYQYVRWGQTSLWGSSGVMESKAVLLKWMQEDPVDTWELGRNDSVESITGTRNVFVDYPELTFVLFGEQVPSDYTTPSGNAKNSSSNNNSNTSGTQSNDHNSNQNNTQDNTQIDTQNSNTQNNTSITQNNSTASTSQTCLHKKAYKIAAEEPRCTSEGFTVGTYCPDCKLYISGHKVVEAIGHKHSGDCDIDCDVCGQTRETDLEHDYDDSAVCAVCGQAKEELGSSEIVEDNHADTTDSDSATNDDKPKKNGFPWVVVVIVVAVLGAGAVATVLIIKKQKALKQQNIEM